MKDRIAEFLKAENKSSAQFAEEIGVQPSGISHILSGRNKPSLDFVLKMLEKYKFLSTEWLLFGKGSMYNDAQMQDLFDESGKMPDSKIITGTKPEDMPPAANPEGQYAKKVPDGEISVEKIVLLYSDKSFREYIPGKDDKIL